MSDKPRVMLIAPPYRIMKSSRSVFSKNVHRRAHPLIGIGMLASVLHEQGFPVAYLDTAIEGIEQTTPFDDQTDYYGLTPEQTVQRVRDFGPDVVGISCLFTAQYPLTATLARAVKNAVPHVPVVLGGNHATLNWRQVMESGCADYILKGEGEFLFPLLIEAITSRKPLPSAVIAWESLGTGETPGIERIADLNRLPWYNFDLVPLADYWTRGLPQAPFAKSKKAILYETSRGCPEHCIFCSTVQFFGHRFRPKSVEHVVQEITHAVQRYGVEEVQFSDDNLALNLKRFCGICDGLSDLGLHLCAPNGIRFDYRFSGDDSIRPVYAKMKAAGFYQVTFAPESGNEYILNQVIKKRLDLTKLTRLVAIAREEFGFRTHAFFIVGFPYETREQIQETFAYAEALHADSYSIALATPFPPTELWEWCQREHLIREGITESDMLFGTPAIKRFDGLTPDDLQVWADEVSARLNARGRGV